MELVSFDYYQIIKKQKGRTHRRIAVEENPSRRYKRENDGQLLNFVITTFELYARFYWMLLMLVYIIDHIILKYHSVDRNLGTLFLAWLAPSITNCQFCNHLFSQLILSNSGKSWVHGRHGEQRLWQILVRLRIRPYIIW